MALTKADIIQTVSEASGFSKKQSMETVETLLASLPISRLATPEDVINVIDFFASPGSGYVTGQTVFLGGIHR